MYELHIYKYYMGHVKRIGYVKYELIKMVYMLLCNGGMKKCQGLRLNLKLRFLAPFL